MRPANARRTPPAAVSPLLCGLVDCLLRQALRLKKGLLRRRLAVQRLLNGEPQRVQDAVQSQIDGEPAAVARDLHQRLVVAVGLERILCPVGFVARGQLEPPGNRVVVDLAVQPVHRFPGQLGVLRTLWDGKEPSAEQDAWAVTDLPRRRSGHAPPGTPRHIGGLLGLPRPDAYGLADPPRRDALPERRARVQER